MAGDRRWIENFHHLSKKSLFFVKRGKACTRKNTRKPAENTLTAKTRPQSEQQQRAAA
jgi:hypothetical protein